MSGLERYLTGEAVEAALDATLAHGTLAFPCEDGERTCAECGYAFGWVAGSDAVEAQRYVEHRVRAALEAAAPAIAAKALRDAADGYPTGGRADGPPRGGSRPAVILGTPVAVVWLRARADQIHPEGLLT